MPSSPVSPKPLRSTVLGALLGLLFGIAAALVRNSLDRRLRDASQIKETLDLPVVGTVRIEALGNAAYVPNGRGPMTDQDVESFRILRTNLEFLDVDQPDQVDRRDEPAARGGQVDGGRVARGRLRRVGASARCSSSATCGGPSLPSGCRSSAPRAHRLPRRPGHRRARSCRSCTLSEAEHPAEGPRRRFGVERSRRANSWSSPRARSPSDPAELLGSRRFRDFLEQVVAAYDMVVLDTPPLLSVSDTLEIVPLVDSVVLCIRADQTTRDQARAVKDALAHLPPRTTGIVVTGLKPGREQDYGYYSYAYYGES